MILLKNINNKNELKRFMDCLVGGIKSDFQNKDIFIKPNLGGRYPVLKSENNDVEFMRVLCSALLNHGCRNIEIGHSSLHGYEYDKKYSFDNLIKLSRYTKLRSLKNVKLVNLDNVKRYKEKSDGIIFEIPELLRDKYYLNVCKLKTHMETGVSLSLKNQMGMVSMENRKEMHRYGIHKYIAYLGKVIVPNLNIIDGMVSMEGNGPHNGKNVRAGILVCGGNMVESDSLACKMAGIDCSQIEHLMLAVKEGIGDLVEDVRVDGKNIRKLLPAHNYIKKGTSLYVWPSTACSGCLFSLKKAVADIALSKDALKLIKKSFLIRTDIFMGHCEKLLSDNESIVKNVIAIGNCTKNAVTKCGVKKFVFGCPPTIEEIKKILNS